jgi:hypothetical protein
MSNRIMRALIALYPRAFRRRYGTELRDLLEELEGAGDRSRLRLVGGLLAGAATERLRATRPAAARSIIAVIALAVSASIPLMSTSATHHVIEATAPTLEGMPVTSAPPLPRPLPVMAVGALPTPPTTRDGRAHLVGPRPVPIASSVAPAHARATQGPQL